MGMKGLLEVNKIKTSIENLAITQYNNENSSDNDKYTIAEGYKAYNGSEFITGVELGTTEENKKIITNNFENTDVVPRNSLNFVLNNDYFITGTTEKGQYYPSTIKDYKTSPEKIRRGKKALYDLYTKEVYKGTGNFIDNNSSNLIDNTVLSKYYKDSSKYISAQTSLSSVAGLKIIYPISDSSESTESLILDENKVEFGKIFLDPVACNLKLGNLPILTMNLSNDPYSVNNSTIVIGPGKLKLFRKGAYNGNMKVLPLPVLIPRKEYASTTPNSYKTDSAILERTLVISNSCFSTSLVSLKTITPDKYYSLDGSVIKSCKDFNYATVNHGTKISNIIFKITYAPSSTTVISNKMLIAKINSNINDDGAFEYSAMYNAAGSTVNASKYALHLTGALVGPVIYSNKINITK